MAKELIAHVGPHARLYRCSRTGIAWVEDGMTGMGHSAHPNIDSTGSVRGMKALGYWGKHDRVVRTCGFAYNIDHVSVNKDDEYDMLALRSCRCEGDHRGRV